MALIDEQPSYQLVQNRFFAFICYSWKITDLVYLNMFQLIEKLIMFVCVWTLSGFLSIAASVQLIFLYIVKCKSMPWSLKDRILMEPPACLTNPIYGTHKYATFNRVRFHYVESGEKNKALILFLHGFPEFWFSWRHQIIEFSKDYRVVALDSRGVHQSDKPRGVENYQLDALVADLKAFIEFLNPKKCILICHDWGAFVGWKFIEKYKHKIYKYVMLSNPPIEVYYKLTLNTMDQLKKSLHHFVYKMPVLPEKILCADDFSAFFDMRNRKFSENFSENDLETYKYVYSKNGALTAGINYFRANSTFISHSKRNQIDGSDGMFIMGQLESNISHAACIVMSNDYPKLRVEVIQNANHFVHQDAPLTTNALIREFLCSE